MSLYRDLDNIEQEDELTKFELSLTDRFGPVPQQAADLIEVVRLRWVAIELGMERVIMKNGKMICHFITKKDSPFYQSPAFSKVLQWVQQNHGKCQFKEDKGKLTMTFEKIKSASKAHEVLKGI